ncbi:hypothetical protein P280DRAFT_360914, partial [Massarina eburnea CBS 473.64]
KVAKILPDIAVKFSAGVYQNEATTMDYGFRHMNNDSLRVPRVYRFFTHGHFFDMPIGYIVMEFVPGVTLEKYDVGSELMERIARAVNHLSTLPIPSSQGPGPVYGGMPRGYLWSDYGAYTSFASLRDMETWLNQRLDICRQPARFSLNSTELLFAHMDIARRNIILTTEGDLCFIDWAHSGFYPRSFQ